MTKVRIMSPPGSPSFRSEEIIVEAKNAIFDPLNAVLSWEKKPHVKIQGLTESFHIEWNIGFNGGRIHPKYYNECIK